jgi:NAD-dependent deacetylase
VVQPAALLPVEAKRAGARLVLVNLSETPLDSLTDIILIGKAGPTMESLMAAFRAMSA